MTDDEYSVSGIKTGDFEFPDTATPLVNDDKAEDSDDFWASFKSELRSGETSKSAPQPTRPKPAPQQAAKPTPQPAVKPKPAAPKPKAKPADEYDLESILAEFRDL